jgi:hypothetical protein
MSASELALKGAELLFAGRLPESFLLLLFELLLEEGELTLRVEGEFSVLDPGEI